MSYVKLPVRTNADSASSADINQLIENCDISYQTYLALQSYYQTERTITPGSPSAIDWSEGFRAKITLTGVTTFDFDDPPHPTHLQIRVISDGAYSLSFNQSIIWQHGAAFGDTTGSNKVDIISFYFDGTTYYGMYAKDF